MTWNLHFPSIGNQEYHWMLDIEVQGILQQLLSRLNIWVLPFGRRRLMATHSSTLAWWIPWTEEPGRLQFMGSQRVGHDWVTFTFTFHFHALEKEMATHSSVLAWRLPGMGEPGGLLSLGSHKVGHDWSDLAAAAAFGSLCLIIRFNQLKVKGSF